MAGDISALVEDEVNKYVNIYSNYQDGTHNGGIVEANFFRELGGDEGLITASMVGTYRMTFDAKHPESGACGSTSSDGNSGGTCSAFIKVLNSSDFTQLLFEQTDTTELTTEWQTLTLDFEITEAMVGHIYQSGFMNTAGNYAPTGVHYDNVKVEAYSETVQVTVTNVGNDYYMNGVKHGSITVKRGQTVVFDTSAFGNNHPFRLSKTQDGTFGGGSA